MTGNSKVTKDGRESDYFSPDKLQKLLCQGNDGPNNLDLLLRGSQQLTDQLLDEMDQEKRIRYFEQEIGQLLQSCFSNLSKAEEIKIIIWKGKSYERLGAWEKALSTLQQAISLCQSAEFTAQRAQAHRWIGHILIMKNRFAEALQSYEESLRLAQQSGDKKEEANSYNGLASHHFEKGALDKASLYWEKALELALKMNEIKLQANCYNNLGIVANVQGNREKALDYYGKSLQSYESIDDLRGQAKVHYNIARTYAESGRWSEAGQQYDRSFRLAKEVGDVHTQANIKLNRAELYLAIGNSRLAEVACHQALQTYLKLEDRLGEADVFKFLGVISTGKKKWAAAQSHFERGIQLTRKVKSPLCEAEARLEYGRMFKQKGDNSDAEEQFRLALKLFTQLKAQKQIKIVKEELAEPQRQSSLAELS